MVTPEAVARIVERRDEAAFVEQLRAEDAASEHVARFERDLASALRAEPELIDRWATWSADQRWSPSAYVDGQEAGWYDSGRQHVRVHSDAAEAVADFVHRMSAWLARRHVIVLDK